MELKDYTNVFAGEALTRLITLQALVENMYSKIGLPEQYLANLNEAIDSCNELLELVEKM